MVKCDDFGRYFGNEKIIKSNCFPLKSDDIKCNQLFQWLNELKNNKLIEFYIGTDDKTYLQLTTWDKHQQIRAKKSKFPDVKSFDINCNQLQTIVPVIQSNPIRIRESESITEQSPLEKAVCDFIEFRKKSKKPMTEKAITLFKNKLNKMAEDDETKIAIIDQSILKGWTDIYPLKEQGGGQSEYTKGTKSVCKDTDKYSKVGFTL